MNTNNNNTQIPILYCLTPSCEYTPSVIVTSLNTLYYNCLCLPKKKLFNINEFMNKLKEINDNNSTSYKYGERSCGLVVSHTNAHAVEYCKNCCAWICEKCAKAHSKYISFTKHKRMKYKIDMYCSSHKNKKYLCYCSSCNKHLCRKCVDKHGHKDELVKLDNDELGKLVENNMKILSKGKMFMKEVEELKQKVVNMYMEEIKKVEKAYSNWLKNNEGIVNVVDVLLRNYEINKNNMNCINNVIDNNIQFDTKHNFSELHISNTLQMNDFLNYLNTHTILSINNDTNNINNNAHNNINHSTDNITLTSSIINKPITSLTNTITFPSSHKSQINTLLILSDNNRIASCSGDHSINIFSFSFTTKQYHCDITKLHAHDNSILTLLEFNSSILISGSGDKLIKIWNLSQHELTLQSILSSHTEAVWKVISISNSEIASCSWDKTIRIWSVTSAEQTTALIGHTGPIVSVLKLNYQNDVLVSVGNKNDRKLIMWRLEPIKSEKVLEGICAMKWNSMVEIDNGFVIVGGEEVIYVVNPSLTGCKLERRINCAGFRGCGWVSAVVLFRGGFIVQFKGKVFAIEGDKYEVGFKKGKEGDFAQMGLCNYNDEYLIAATNKYEISIWKFE